MGKNSSKPVSFLLQVYIVLIQSLMLVKENPGFTNVRYTTTDFLPVYLRTLPDHCPLDPMIYVSVSIMQTAIDTACTDPHPP